MRSRLWPIVAILACSNIWILFFQKINDGKGGVSKRVREEGECFTIDDASASTYRSVDDRHQTKTGDSGSYSKPESDLFRIVKKILYKIDAIEDYLIKLDVRMEKLSRDHNDSTHGIIDMTELKLLSLPADSLESLANFERKLKDDERYKSKLVRYFRNYIFENILNF